MASVTITIPNSSWTFGSSRGSWNPPNSEHIDLGPSLSTNGNTSLFLGRLIIPRSSSANFEIQLSDGNAAEDFPGPEFSTQMETSGAIIMVASNGASVTVTGIGDATEPYGWVPSNQPSLNTFADTLNGLSNRSLAITFNDNADFAPSFTDDTGDAQAWTQNTAITNITVPEADGSPAPTYAVVGSLPSGIAFDTGTRVISGTPTAAGSGTITVRATNSEGTADWTVAYTTTGIDAAPSFADDTGNNQFWTQNQAITDIVVPVADGHPTPTYAVVGSLPVGIIFTALTRTLSGTPSAIGSGTITIRATNSEGSGDWTVAYTTRVSGAQPTVTLEIDWDNDGTFGHAAADVTGDLVRHTLRSTRGRTLQSRRKAPAGRLEARIWNLGKKYDPFNSSSPIYERNIRGVRVRVQLDGVTVWGGILDDVRYVNFPVPYVQLIALGLKSTLRQPVSVAPQSSETIGAVAKLVGAATGIITTHLGGDKTLDRWVGVDDQEALTVLEDLEETEEGFLYERADGDLELEPEDFRRTGDSAISAMTIKDETEANDDVPLLRGSALDWGFRQIANSVRVPVETLSESAEMTLWTSAQELVVPANNLRIIIINYPNADAPANHRGAASWIEPVAGTDYTAVSGLTLSGSGDGVRYVIAMTNSLSTTITIAEGDLQVRGKALVAGALLWVESEDATSIDTFGEREYPRPSPLFTDIGEAQEYADGIVAASASPNGWLVARWPAYTAVSMARTLELSRRITVLRDAEQIDYYIEGVSIALIGFTRMEYLLSPVPGAGRPFTPGVTLALVGGQPTHIAVSWVAPFDGGSAITDYDVQYRQLGTAMWNDFAHVGTVLSTTITGLSTGTGIVYEVRVRARSALGEGPWGSATLGLLGVPSLPSITLFREFFDVGSQSLRMHVRWNAPSTDGGSPIISYEIQARSATSEALVSSATYSALLDSPFSATTRVASYSVGTALRWHQVRIRAVNAIGSGAWEESSVDYA